MYQNNLSAFQSFYSLAEVEVGKHLYWEIAGLKLHGQVFIVSWLVIAALLTFAIAGTRDLKQTPEGLQNFMEYAYEFLQDIAKNQIGEEEYRPWVPYVSTVFLFIFRSKLGWSSYSLETDYSLPEGELAAPTNDINVTVALALLTSFSYFYAGLSKKGIGYFARYVQSYSYSSSY